MQSLYDYDIYIFDCDGVILDSNHLKIEAMKKALQSLSFDEIYINRCIEYFKNNFGKSRFHHVDIFLNDYLVLDESMRERARALILDSYSCECKQLYVSAEVTPGFIDFIESINGRKYIASGSEQNELRDVFKHRSIDAYFSDILGSPVRKSQLISDILNKEASKNAIMFGDAVSDFDAAKINGIDFIAYLPFSNVKNIMVELAKKNKFSVFYEWPTNDKKDIN